MSAFLQGLPLLLGSKILRFGSYEDIPVLKSNTPGLVVQKWAVTNLHSTKAKSCERFRDYIIKCENSEFWLGRLAFQECLIKMERHYLPNH